jgi:glycosyltransferase involved in cell wall biosynthesis
MISFVIPTLNEEKIIEKILKCLSLYKGDKEIIVSDGHSKDKTCEIAERYGMVARHDGSYRQTIAGGRNAGAKMAHGDYFLFLDADIFIPDINTFLPKAEEYFNRDPKLVALTVSIRVFPEYETLPDKISFSLCDFYNYFSNNIIHFGASMGEFQMIKKEVFQKLGGYNEKIAVGEDQEMFQRLARHGKTLFAKDLRVYHTGRRAHKVGWATLWFTWIRDGIAVFFFKKSVSAEWVEVR